jgi:hypothetical protein
MMMSVIHPLPHLRVASLLCGPSLVRTIDRATEVIIVTGHTKINISDDFHPKRAPVRPFLHGDRLCDGLHRCIRA